MSDPGITRLDVAVAGVGGLVLSVCVWTIRWARRVDDSLFTDWADPGPDDEGDD